MNDEVKIYGFSGSHPCEAVSAAARYKGFTVRTVEVPPALHRLIMRVRFGGTRVPGALIDERKVQGTTAIFHALDQAVPEHPLFPDEPAARAAVERAEHWGEGDFQDIGRRLIWSHLSRSPDTVRTWIRNSPAGFAHGFKIWAAPYVAQIAKRANRASDENVCADLARLPELLDRVDELIAEGVIGGDQPNAADFQILSTVGLWMNMQDIRPAIESRPCGAAAMRLFPRYTGAVPGGLLPDEWFSALRESAGSAISSTA